MSQLFTTILNLQVNYKIIQILIKYHLIKIKLLLILRGDLFLQTILCIFKISKTMAKNKNKIYNPSKILGEILENY
jgi:hypothetical protein